MLLSWVQTGLIWYYFNTLAIAYIVYMLLKIALVRAERSMINRSESAAREERKLIKLIIFISIFAIAYFAMREYIAEFRKLWISIIEFIQGLFNG